MNKTVRTRFAPSPTGYLHLGGLRTALYAYLFARKHGGTFILRIEDTDQEREVPGAAEMIYRSLRAAGLRYDEGPDVGGDFGPYIQTQRKPLYLPLAWELVERGGAYPCFCTREQLDERRAQAEAGEKTWKYDKRCLAIPPAQAKERADAGEPHVIRQNVPAAGTAGFDDLLYGRVEVPCDTLDDTVLIKADGLPTYNFANVVDDHLMAVTHVMRGTEYLSSAPKYDLLYRSFGWEPPLSLHLPVVMIADQGAVRKLSKRKGDPSFEDLLAQGYLRDAVINYIALLGWSPGGEREVFSLAELERAFDEKGLSKSPSVFDIQKLNWFNGEYVRALPFGDYLALAKPWIERALGADGLDPARLRRLCEMLHSRTDVFDQLPGMVDFLAKMPAYDVALYTHKKMKTDPQVALAGLKAALPALEGPREWTEAALHEALLAAVAAAGMKNGQVLWPLRVALTGRESSPGGAIEMAYLLGKDQSLTRVRAAMARLKETNEGANP
ncbi:MAG: glutamate--tRNA ligase [Clostridia bacterium]|nr:glutamate--tRNA ligase [Clostridia bacterium]